MPPPLEELEKLYELAMLGKISGIRKWAKQITQLNAQYQPFAEQVRQLAQDFEDDKIVVLAEQHLNHHPDT